MIRAATQEEIKHVLPALPLYYHENMRAVCNEGAMVIYDGWTPRAVQVHIFSRGPKYLFRRDFVSAIFYYPFIEASKSILYTVTPESSESNVVSKALGFRETHRIKDGWDVGVDMVIKEMTREECRYV